MRKKNYIYILCPSF